MKDIDFLVNCIAENSNKLHKSGVEKEKAVEPLMCSHW